MTNARQVVADFLDECGAAVELILLRRGFDLFEIAARSGWPSLFTALGAKVAYEETPACCCANPSCGLEMLPEDEPEALLVVMPYGGRKSLALATCQRCAELMTDREITAHLLELWPVTAIFRRGAQA